MSHLRQCSITIANPNESILRRAIELIAREEGKQLCTTVVAMNGDRTEVLAGIQGMNYQYAYGVVIKGGRIHVVGDDYGSSVTLNAFRQRVVQAYNVVAYQQALARQGYRTQVQRQGAKYILAGVRA